MSFTLQSTTGHGSGYETVGVEEGHLGKLLEICAGFNQLGVALCTRLRAIKAITGKSLQMSENRRIILRFFIDI